MKLLLAHIIAHSAMGKLQENIVVDIEDFFDGFISAFGPWDVDFTAFIHDARKQSQKLILSIRKPRRWTGNIYSSWSNS